MIQMKVSSRILLQIWCQKVGTEVAVVESTSYFSCEKFNQYTHEYKLNIPITWAIEGWQLLL